MTEEQYQPPAATPEPEASASTEPTAQPVAATVTKADIEKNKMWAVVAYLTIIGFIIALVSEGKDSPFVKFHLNQSLCLLIAAIANIIVASIPILGWIIAPIIGIVILVFVIMGIINAAGGQMKRLPLIGNFDLIK